MTNGAAAGAAAAAAAANAIKASGAIVRVPPETFTALLNTSDHPLVVESEGGLFSKHFAYLMGYRGLVFYTKSPDPLLLPAGAEVVRAKSIWIPG